MLNNLSVRKRRMDHVPLAMLNCQNTEVAWKAVLPQGDYGPFLPVEPPLGVENLVEIVREKIPGVGWRVFKYRERIEATRFRNVENQSVAINAAVIKTTMTIRSTFKVTGSLDNLLPLMSEHGTDRFRPDLEGPDTPGS